MIAITILGNNSAIPAFDRHPTSQVLQTLEESYLIDCGEGTKLQMAKYKIRRSKIKHILISHLHGDHYFGLIGLLNSMSLLGRTQELHLHAPAALKEIIDLQFKVAQTNISFNLFFHPLEKEGIIIEENKITVECFKVLHRIECWGFLFREKKFPRKINSEKVKAYEIPSCFYEKLQMGHDYITAKGTIIPNAEVTDARSKPKSYAFCADTRFDERLIDIVRDVDLLYHEATFLSESADKAFARFHSTTDQAATIAQQAGVGRLLLGHFSSKYEDLSPFLSEATKIFRNTDLALEGICYKI